MLATIRFEFGGQPVKAVLHGSPPKWFVECERPESKFSIETLLNDLFDPADDDKGPAGGAAGARSAAAAAEFFSGKVELPNYQDSPGRIY